MLDGHLAELVTDRAEGRDRLTELLALHGVAGRLRDRQLGAAAAHRRQLEPAVVEHVEGDLVAPADFAEDVARGHAHVLHQERRRRRAVEPELVLLLPRTDAGKAPLDEERREELRVHLGKDDEEVGEAAVGDPHLLAAEDEAAVSLAGCPRLGAERIRARARLAQRIGADDLAAHEAGQVALLLFLGAEAEERGNREAGLRAERRREGRRLSNRLADDDRRDLVELDATVRLGHVRAEEAEVAGTADECAGERPVLLLELVEDRQHLARDELLGRLPDQLVLVAQPLGREDWLGGFFDQPGPAACSCDGCHVMHSASSTGLRLIRSKIPAAPIPPPTHIVTIP